MITLTYPQIQDLTNLMRDRRHVSVTIAGDHVTLNSAKLKWDEDKKRWAYESHEEYVRANQSMSLSERRPV